MKSYRAFLNEAKLKPGAGKATLKNVLHTDLDMAIDDLKAMRIKYKQTSGGSHSSGDEYYLTLTGTKKDLFLYLTSAGYGLSDQDVAKEFPELFEATVNEVARPADHYKKEFYKLEEIRRWLLDQESYYKNNRLVAGNRHKLTPKHFAKAAQYVEMAQNEMLKSQ